MKHGTVGTLLVIDDSVSVRKKIIELMSSGKDFEKFLEAEDGISGLKIMAENQVSVDVVACDLNMPGLDGFGFLKAARLKPEFMGIPIVMVTSRSDDREMVRAFKLGANDFIVKPFNEAILKARLKNMLHIKSLQDELKAQKEMVEKTATIDHLTNISNQRCFRQNLEEELNRAVRYDEPLSLLMVDLDHFKKVNDTFGHPLGDSVLKQSARILVEVMRSVDFVARYGGDEFVVIMPHTDRDGAENAAERLRSAFESRRFNGLGKKGALTVSVGAATYRSGMKVDAENLVELADKALYMAKMGGRNRVEISRVCVK